MKGLYVWAAFVEYPCVVLHGFGGYYGCFYWLPVAAVLLVTRLFMVLLSIVNG